MTISIDEFIRNSFVISTSNEKYDIFCKVFSRAGFSSFPKWFHAIKIKDGNRGHSNKLNCSLSHLCVLKMAQQLNLPFVVVFEDDVVPHKYIQKLLQWYLTNIPDNVGLIKLGWSKIPIKSPRPKIVSEKFNISKTRGGHAYIVFREYYEKLINTLEQEDILIDMKSFAYKMTTNHNLFVQYNGDDTSKISITGSCQTSEVLMRHGIDPNDYFLDKQLHN